MLLLVTSQVRPQVEEAAKQADAFVSDLDEDKALVLLDGLLEGDNTPEEVALLQAWRGAALFGLNKKKEATQAFALAKGCDKALVVPAFVSPKVTQAFKKAKAAKCPVKAPPVEAAPVVAPEPAPAPAPAEEDDMGMEFTLKVTPEAKPAPTPDQEKMFEGPSDAPEKKPAPPVAAKPDKPAEGGGPNIKAIAGGGVAALGGALAAVALAALVGGAGSLVGSFPVHSYGEGQEEVTNYRRALQTAFVLRLAGAGALPLGALLGLGGLVVLGAGVGVLVWGLVG
jgi:hypothetical protein